MEKPCHYSRWLGVLLMLLLIGCDRREIEVYSVAKEAGATASESAEVALPEEIPENWQPLDTANSPRLASFRVASADGDGDSVADMGVTSFPGAAGGLLANVNRWRGEVGIDQVTQGELDDSLDKIEVGGHVIHLMDAAGSERRTLGAILPLASNTFFFKLTGPVEVVSANEEAFQKYVAAIEIGEGAAAAPAQSTDAPPDRPGLTYQKPDGWVEGETTPMRAASFSVSGGEGREADISVIPLGGSGGAELVIVNQWRSTLRLDEISEDQLPTMIEEQEIGGRPFKLSDIESEEPMLEGDRKARIIVAFSTVGEHTWFFKIAGETSLVAEQKPILLEFLKTVEFEK